VKRIRQVKNSFWEVLHSLNDFHALFKNRRDEIIHNSIWYNSKILKGGKYCIYCIIVSANDVCD